MTLAVGTRTLTLQITDPESGDSLSCYVFLTSDAAGKNVVGSAGTVTPAQTSNGQALTFTPTINVAAAGTYYGWAVVEKNGAVYGVYPQGQLTISTPYNFTIDAQIQSGVSFGVANYAWTVNIKQFLASMQISKGDWQNALANKGLPSNYVPVFLFTLSGQGWTSEYFMSTQDGGSVWESGNPAETIDESIGSGDSERDYYVNVPFSLFCSFNPYVGLNPMPLGNYTISCRIAYMQNYSNFTGLPTTLVTSPGQCNLAQHPASSDFVTVIGPFNPGITTQCVA